MAAYAAAGRSSGPVIRSMSPSSGFSRRYSAHSPPLQSSSATASFSGRMEKPATAPCRRACLCAPTNHPGSFRCSLHKGGGGNVSSSSQTASYRSSRGLNLQQSTVKNSPAVRSSNGGGGFVKRAMAALIRPSFHQQQRRRGEFRCGPSRLSVMSKA